MLDFSFFIFKRVVLFIFIFLLLKVVKWRFDKDLIWFNLIYVWLVVNWVFLNDSEICFIVCFCILWIVVDYVRVSGYWVLLIINVDLLFKENWEVVIVIGKFFDCRESGSVDFVDLLICLFLNFIIIILFKGWFLFNFIVEMLLFVLFINLLDMFKFLIIEIFVLIVRWSIELSLFVKCWFLGICNFFLFCIFSWLWEWIVMVVVFEIWSNFCLLKLCICWFVWKMSR